jgi:hypothetical protein
VLTIGNKKLQAKTIGTPWEQMQSLLFTVRHTSYCTFLESSLIFGKKKNNDFFYLHYVPIVL